MPRVEEVKERLIRDIDDVEVWIAEEDGWHDLVQRISLALRAHLSDFEAHKDNFGKCSRCYNECHSRSGLLCDESCNTYENYPCGFIIRKAQKLSGEPNA